MIGIKLFIIQSRKRNYTVVLNWKLRLAWKASCGTHNTPEGKKGLEVANPSLGPGLILFLWLFLINVNAFKNTFCG